ncbi:MAG TPA: PhnD/SsuA/transferrin family substrate-binding protein, partial [Isosphaeraceae bacterium]
MRRHPWLAWLLMLAPAATPATGRSADPARPVRLGVLAYRGADDARRRWQPTADYLTAQIPGHTFAIVPLAWDAIAPAVERHDVDFVATSPANYVALEALFGAARIATLVRERHGVICKSYGAIIFARADRDDIRTLKDLRGKTFRAADAESFGGWWMALRELLERDLDPLRDFAALRFGGNQDTVVLDVRDGRADAGTVRDDDLERMANEGQIDPATFRILNRQPLTPEYPFARSTRLYPEWPLATLKGTPDELAQEVAVALLKMP